MLPEKLILGNPTGMGVDRSQHIFIFHRADRKWSSDIPLPETCISSKTILMLDRESGKILNSWGDDLFIMPHGLTVDLDNNIWVTDVGLHQVFKFSHEGKLLMKFGDAKVSGSDSTHFFHPTDVAIANDGSFYVSDGYGNSRIMKFSSAGEYLFEWGKKGDQEGEFNLPHAIDLDDEGNVYVADRENSRVQVFTPTGKFINQWADESFGKINSVGYDKAGKGFVAVDCTSTGSEEEHYFSDLLLFDSSGTFLKKKDRDHFKKEGKDCWYHNVVVDDQGSIYITDIIGNKIKKFVHPLIAMIIFIFINTYLFGQIPANSLFSTQDPLHIQLSISTKDIRQSKRDSTYLSNMLYYGNVSGKLDSIKAGLKGRGNFRFKACYFAPLWIKIKKNNARGTVFEGNQKLKIILPCNSPESYNALILKEYLCYKLYEEITPYAFHTRLADIKLTVRDKRNKIYKLKGILLEDIDEVATRFHAKSLSQVFLSPSVINDTTAVRFELFQYMISNTDWSLVHQHNIKLIVQDKTKIIPLIYDFDMSGLVDAPYAVVSQVDGESLDVKSVTDRLYRGYCRSPETMQFVRQEYISKKEKLLALSDQLEGQLADKEIKDIKNYLGDFFSILQDDRLFKTFVLNKCRAIH